jgi:hypothetical protein
MEFRRAISTMREFIQKALDRFALAVLLWIEKTPSDGSPQPQHWMNRRL